MVEEIKDAKSDSSTDTQDAKPGSSTGTDEFGEQISTPPGEGQIQQEVEQEEDDTPEVRDDVPLQNQIGELRRKLEESEAEKARTFALLEETLNRAPTGVPMEADETGGYDKKLEELGIDPDVTSILKELNQHEVSKGIAALRAEIGPLQEGLVVSQERAAVTRVLEAKGSELLKGKESEIYDLIGQYRTEVRAKMGADKVAQEAVATVSGHYLDDLVEERVKASRKKGKSSKRIVSESLSDASMMSSGPTDTLTAQEKAYVSAQRAKGSEITEDGFLKAKNRIAERNAKMMGA